MKRCLRRLLLCVVLLGATLAPVSAQIVLKPNGQAGILLRVRALAANVTIDRQFATTRLTLTFVNDTSERIVADFLYTLPPDTLVTSFAYWYGDEKVDAKIVEKEVAEAIITHITAQMRDPALIELVGKRTFRARIFPVMPNTDLQVEMEMTQTLTSDAKGAYYTLPLQAKKGQTLDTAQINVRVKGDADIANVTNNYGVPVKRKGEDYHFAFSGKNYRPQKDLRVALARKPKPLHAALHSASSGGHDGFFALALTPNRALNHPKIAIRGVTTYETAPTTLLDVEAHHALTLFGRYKGNGAATVTLTGETSSGPQTYHATVHFSGERVENNLATKLWAAQRIEALSASGGNRNAVLAMSLRYGLPSKYASWLAVPKEEMRQYKHEVVVGKVAGLVSRLANEILHHRESGKMARQLQQQLNQVCRRYGEDPKETLRERLYDEVANATSQVASAIFDHRQDSAQGRQLRQRLNLLCQLTGENPKEAVRMRVVEEEGRLAVAFAEAVSTHKQDSAIAQQLRSRLESLCRVTGDNPEEQVKGGLDEYATIQDPSRRQKVNSDVYTLDDRIAKLPLNSEEYAALTRERDELVRREEELRVRVGDPLISIEAPADAQQVIAILPGGEIKRLAYNTAVKRWEARFDIPGYAHDGAYDITVLVVAKDGARKTLTVRYHVVTTPPTGNGQARLTPDAKRTLRLEMEASEDTARVKALLPWGEEVALSASGLPHHFFALVAVPLSARNTPSVVTYILTDKAHNRTVLYVDMTP